MQSSLFIFRRYALLNENALCRDTAEVRGVNYFVCLCASLPAPCQCLGHGIKHCPRGLSLLHSVFCRGSQEAGKGSPSAGSCEGWQSPPSLGGTQDKGCPGPAENGEGQGEEEGIWSSARYLGRTGSMAVPLWVLSLFSFPATPTPLPQTSLASPHSSELRSLAHVLFI